MNEVNKCFCVILNLSVCFGLQKVWPLNYMTTYCSLLLFTVGCQLLSCSLWLKMPAIGSFHPVLQ